MTEIDTSIYQNQVQPPNPLNQLQQFTSLQHSMGANQLQQQEIRGRAALGKAIQASTGPDGVVNTNALTRMVSQDPDASWMALQTQREAEQNNALTNYTVKNPQTGAYEQRQAPLPNVLGMGNPGQQVAPPTQDKIDGLHRHFKALSDTLTPLADNPEVSESDVIHGVTNLVSHPDAQFTPQDAAKELMGLPVGPNGTPPSSSQIQAAVQQKLAKIHATRAAITQKYPPTSLSNPPQQQPQQVSGGQDSNQQQPQDPQQASTQPMQDPNQQSPQVNQTQMPLQQQPQPPGVQGSLTAPPMGQGELVNNSVANVKKVNEEAEVANKTLPLLSNIMNLSKNGASTGTIKGALSQYLAAHGIAPAGVEKGASDAQIINKYMEQALLASGMPGSDSRLEALQSANPNPGQLPQTIQKIVPFLQAVNKGKLIKQKYYQQHVGMGQDPQAEQQAAQSWNTGFDPRLIELNDLQKNDPKAFKEYLTTLGDASDLAKKHKAAQQLGVYDQ